MHDHDRTALSRRRFVAGLGLGAIGLAGCLDGGSEDGSSDAGNDTSADQSNEELELTDHPGTEPIDAPLEYHCPICNMRASQFPDWNAQLAHEAGGVFFDTAGCLFAYVADPEARGAPDDEIIGAWVTEFETNETIDALTASFVREHDSDRVDDPMRVNPAPFADRDDALAYVDSYDDLSEDDIMGFDDVGEAEADLYRGGR